MKGLKIATNIVLIILLVLSSIGAVITGTVGSLSNSDAYTKEILNTDFYDLFTSSIRDSIDSNSSIVDIGTDGAMEALDELKLKEFINKYTITLTKNITDGTSDSYSANFNSTELYNYIRLQFDKYKDDIIDDADYKPTTAYTDDAYDTLIYEINNTLNYLPESYLNKGMQYIDSAVAEKTGGHFSLSSVYNAVGKLDTVFIILLILSVLLIIAIMLINYKKPATSIFKIGSALFFSGIALFVPSLTIKVFDISSRLCLADSPLSYYVTTFIHTIEDAFFTGSIIFLGVSLVILLGGAAAWIITTRNKNKRIDEDNQRLALEKANQDTAPEDVQVLL